MFVRNHAQSIVACDFLVVVTARFRTLYVFLLMEVGTRRIVHCNVTAHPAAAWTLQQLREAILSDHSYRFLIHDRDSIFLGRGGPAAQSFWIAGAAHARASAKSKRLL
jgi:putative transposase